MSTKSRFSTTDVRVMVRDLWEVLQGQRVANVYNLSNKTYLFKFAVPGKAEKDMLLMESGVRFHTTSFNHDKTEMPNVFSRKLRAAIRHKRLEGIRQIGSDRVVDFKFGSGDSVAHVLLELYSSGNIILTDGSFEIVAALRTHEFEDGVNIKVGEVYPISHATTLGETLGSASSILAKTPAEFISWATATEKQYAETQARNAASKKGGKIKKMVLRHLLQSKESGVSGVGPEIIDHCLHLAGLKPSCKVVDFLSGSSTDNTIFDAESNGSVATAMSIQDSALTSAADRLLVEFAKGIKLLELFDGPSSPGYILMKPTQHKQPQQEKKKQAFVVNAVSVNPELNQSAGGVPVSDANDPEEGQQCDTTLSTISSNNKEGEDAAKDQEVEYEYTDFIPYLFEQHKSNAHIKPFPSFTAAVDDYFCKIEEQKLGKAARAAEEAAYRRIDKTIEDQRRMLQGLGRAQSILEAQAASVETCNTEVDKVRMVINSALSNRMTWVDISDMVAAERAGGNPIAALVHSLDLANNTVTLTLPNSAYDPCNCSGRTGEEDGATAITASVSASDGDICTRTHIDVTIDLTLSAFNNVRDLYTDRAAARRKEEKAAAASDYVINKVRDQVLKGLESQKLKRTLATTRKVHGFEKFNWFLTSDGYLVLSGRDHSQSDILVKKHMRAGDVYVHADLHGAVPCIVRNKHLSATSIATDTNIAPTAHPITRPVSPLALQEAGLNVVCRSAAWNAKVVTSAWWVGAEFVSKVGTLECSGELPVGVFAVRGEKHYLPPASLEMGFGFMFQVDAPSAERRAADRRLNGSNSSNSNGIEVEAGEEEEETMSIISEASDRYGLDMGFGNSSIEGGDSISTTTTTASRYASRLLPSTSAVVAAARGPVIGSGSSRGSSSSYSGPAATMLASTSSSAGGARRDRDRAEQKGTRPQTEQVSGKAVGGKGVSAALDTDVGSVDSGGGPIVSSGRKRAATKKKNKKYANQDEEDYELAMLALGLANSKKGGKDSGKGGKKGKKDLKTRQEEAGLGLLRVDWVTLLSPLSDQVREEVDAIVAEGIMKEGDLDSFEINTLASFQPAVGCAILMDFKTDVVLKDITNKSGFLAGIMRRYSKIIKNVEPTSNKPTTVDGALLFNSSDSSGVGVVSGGSKLPPPPCHALLSGYDDDDGEGGAEEHPAQFEDDFFSLVSNPTPEDVVLYAVPVCGPYSCFKNFKYKMKLTPGTLKKGKISKQAQDVFVMFKDCSPAERKAIEGLNRAEMTAAVIGEAKISMPGLQAVKRKQKTTNKNEKKKSNSGDGGGNNTNAKKQQKVPQTLKGGGAGGGKKNKKK